MQPPLLAKKSVRTARFKRMFAGLPEKIQKQANDLWKVFKKDPYDKVLENEDLYDSKKGRHRKGSRSVSITLRYRAIYVVDNGKNGDEEEQVCWYWIGSHEDYNNFIGRK